MKRVWLWVASAITSEIQFHLRRALHSKAPDFQKARVIAFALAKTNRMQLKEH